MNDCLGDSELGRRRWFHFSYYVPSRAKRALALHQPRDALAAFCLGSRLAQRGYGFGGPILNYPLAAPPAAERTIAANASFVRADDLLVLPTRPALDDLRDGIRRRVWQSYTALEGKVYAWARRDLAHCSRTRVAVADQHALAHRAVAPLWNVQFRQHGGATVDAHLPYGGSMWVRPPLKPGFTLAYLLYSEHAWKNGPAVLASFGMNGMYTLVWNFHLATSFPGLVCSVPFAMAMIEAPAEIPRAVTLAELAGAFKVSVLTTAAAQAEANA